MAETATTKSILQIVTPDGKACKAIGTENVWVCGAFGLPTGNNEVVPFTTGKDYFAEFVNEVDGAHDEIYITGWQVNWDALVAPGKRLFDVLLAAAQRGVKIYVMPWDDSPPVQTYDDQTKIVFEMINTITGSEHVQVQLAKAHADENASFYTHHQKHVVIDRKTAFVGGIDLAYGRYDDAHFNLRADNEGRSVLNRYNNCVEWVGEVDATTRMVNTDDLKGLVDSYGRNPLSKNSKTNADITLEKIRAAGTWQTPYEEQGIGSLAGSALTTPSAEFNVATRNTLDPKSQPRLPWQDVHCKIVGPAVDDLIRNFVVRWNSTKPTVKLPLPQAKAYPIEGKCLVQVLRSAPLAMCNLEYRMMGASDKKASALPVAAQDDIQKAMVTLIGKAQHFIYIENQFFVSAFGQLAGYEHARRDRDPTTGPAKQIMDAGGGGGRFGTRIMPGDSTKLPHNDIVDALATRLDAFIRQRKPFHVYITLPVHSEGLLNNGAIVGQVHWTMQSLVFGTQSLLNRIRRSFRARELYDKDPHTDWHQAYADHDQGYLEIPLEKCFDYVTLLNLRNWVKLGSGKDERYVTEQVYVHSKLMIVDDRYALLGSANINDRSLLGSRDSELAVMVVDTDNKQRDLKQNGKHVPVRRFARDLRKQVWRKLFGITAGGDKAAHELANAVLHPAAPASWKAIQKRAKQNTDLYEAAFDWIPRNRNVYKQKDRKGNEIFASIWPIWDLSEDKAKDAKKGLMPFEADFWKASRHNPAAAANLKEVKGFITFLPIHWTRNENNKIPYHNDLLTKIEPQGMPSNTTVARNTSSDSLPDTKETSPS